MALLHIKDVVEQAAIKPKYDHYIGGAWVAPASGEYFDNITPITGGVLCQAARGNAEDIGRAVDAAHRAKDAWGKLSAAERSAVLHRIADRIEQHIPRLALVESVDKGKPLRECTFADLPLVVDHFRYFASAVRLQEGKISQIDEHTTAYHYHEPLGVVAAIIPWNFPLLLAAWKMAPALAAGNCIIIKPAEQTPVSIMVLMEIIGDLLPAGVVNVVNGFGAEAGAALSNHPRINKISFTGETNTGRIIMRAAAENIIPVTLELGGKSPNIFFSDIMQHDDALADKAIEGFAMFMLNQGEVCTCPSRVLVQRPIYERFMEKAIARVQKAVVGNPLDMNTMVGSQASKEQMDKILSYFEIGKKEGAKILTGGTRAVLEGELKDGYYVQPTIFEGNNAMRVFQEEIFGPVVSVTPFDSEAEALAIANDTEYGLSAAVWTRDQATSYRMSRGIQAGRVWTNCYHLYPAHAAFGGYKKSGIGRENHHMMLEHYQQTKCVISSFSDAASGFF